MKTPPVDRDECGTEQGYRQHVKHGEERCQPCKTAWNLRCKKYSKKYAGETKPSAEEVIAEIEWMLSLNQGTFYIFKALGYHGREASLVRRLENNDRYDLGVTLTGGERRAA